MEKIGTNIFYLILFEKRQKDERTLFVESKLKRRLIDAPFRRQT